MAGITGLSTTFNTPNYVGELFGLTPAETPLLSSIGGLSGGAQATSTEFEWQTYDLRDPGNRQRLEGQDAPTSEERVRANARNVVEIHQEAVSVSYTKASAIRQRTSPSNAPFYGGVALGSEDPVIDEVSWQINQRVKEVAKDINWGFWNGEFNLPTDNTTARKTRGLLQAIVTNKIHVGQTVTGGGKESASLSAATDTITETATTLADDDKIVFTSTGTALTLVAGRKYFVVNKGTNTFKVATTQGGTAITIGTATGLKYIKPRTSALSIDEIDAIAQLAYDNGGLSDQFSATIAVNSTQRVAVTKAFAGAYGQMNGAVEGNVGGVKVDVVKTNFGSMNIMNDRDIPVDALVIVSLDQLAPVFLSHPDKGVFFIEELAKTGAQEKFQLYGEIGLKYGNERAHAQYRGLAI
jgi:hypothetical protein